MSTEYQNGLGQPIGWPVTVPAAPPPSTEPMVGRYCTLVPLDPATHTNQLFNAYSAASDDGDWTYLPYGPFHDRPSFEQFIQTYANKPDPLFFAVLGSNGQATGVASYLRINGVAASIEVGHIHFSRQLQGTTAATEAMYLMMKRAFDSGYRRYEWKCDALNAASRAAAARFGFSFEGIFRQATHYKGRNRDTAWFAIVDADWPRIEQAFQAWLDPANFDDSGRQRDPLRPHSDS